MDDVYTVAQAARALGVTPRRVCQLLDQGRLPGAERLSPRVAVIPASALDAYRRTRRARGNPGFGPGFWADRQHPKKRARKP